MSEQTNYKSNAISSAISGGSGILGSVVSGLFNLFMNRKNRKVQQEENQKDRDFNAQQAEIARNWEEQMYQNYESPAAQAQQRLQAGLNPVEGVSSQGVGSASSASHSGSISPSSFQDPIGPMISQLPSMIETFKQMRLQTKQMETNLESSTLDLQKKALEAGNYEEAVQLQMELMRDEAKRAKWSAEETRAHAERALEDNEMFKDFKKSGGNTYQTAEDVARESISASESQRKYQDAQTEYQAIMAKIAQEQSPYQIRVLKNQAAALKAQAIQSYANALYSQAQAEVANSTKLKIDAETAILHDKRAQDAAIHLLDVYRKELENIGVKYENINKFYEAQVARIKAGDYKNFGELGAHFYYNIVDWIPFSN